MNIQYTLLSEGSSDQALLPILSFVLRERGAETVESQWADIGRLREPPQALPDQIRTAIDLYPCDLLFVHRDADRVGHGFRREEIIHALDAAGIHVESVCVVPVRMTETWLLIDEGAIRGAAGRPRGRAALNLLNYGDLKRKRTQRLRYTKPSAMPLSCTDAGSATSPSLSGCVVWRNSSETTAHCAGSPRFEPLSRRFELRSIGLGAGRPVATRHGRRRQAGRNPSGLMPTVQLLSARVQVRVLWRYHPRVPLYPGPDPALSR